jgi:hypothetical protein
MVICLSKSYDLLKQKLNSAPDLAIPNSDEPFELVCDACNREPVLFCCKAENLLLLRGVNSLPGSQ